MLKSQVISTKWMLRKATLAVLEELERGLTGYLNF